MSVVLETPTLTYRLLPFDEWDKVEPEFVRQGVTMPNQNLSAIYVAEDEDGNTSFVTLQLQAHAEPLFIHPAHRGTDVHRKLAKMIDESFPANYYAFVPSPEVGMLAASVGMKPLPWKVYVRERI